MNVARRRPYRQTARAERTAATRRRIVVAARDAFLARWYEDVTLNEIAAAAEVSLGTVVNHFGGKEGLLEAVTEDVTAGVEEVRYRAAPGDVDAAVEALVDDYETTGDSVLRALAQEERVPVLRPMLNRGREAHRRWLEHVFGPLLPQGEDRLPLLVVATDVFTWRVLRRDQGLSRHATAAAMRDLITAVLASTSEGRSR